MSDIRPLPARPSVEFERKAAKSLLRQLRSGDNQALQRAQAHERGVTEESVSELKLGDAQRIIAREYGFTSWTRLVQYYGDVERQRYEHMNGTGWRSMMPSPTRLTGRVQRMLGGHAARDEFTGRALAAYVPRFYGCTPEHVFAQSISEADAQLATARFHGFSNWAALLEVAAGDQKVRASDTWHVDEWTDASAAIHAGDLAALERVIAEHPGLLERETEFGVGVQRLLSTALSLAEHDNALVDARIVRWLEARGAVATPLLGFRGGTGTRATYVQGLLDAGADPDWIMPNGRPVLEHALLTWHNRDAVDVLAARAKHRDALWIAAGLGDVAGVARWLDARGKPRAAARRDRPDFSVPAGRMMPQLPDANDDELLQEVFWVAMSNDRGNVIEYLVQRGIDANGTMFNAPYVAVAVAHHWATAVEALVRRGADVHAAGPNFGSAASAARDNFLRWPSTRTRHLTELVGLDPDALLAEQSATPMPEPVLGERVQESLLLASDDARRTGAATVGLENLFIGLLRARNAMQQIVRFAAHINVREFLAVFGERLLPHDQRLSESSVAHSSEVEQALADATAHARVLRREQLSCAHLLTVLVREDGAPIVKLLSRFGANLTLLRQALERS